MHMWVYLISYDIIFFGQILSFPGQFLYLGL